MAATAQLASHIHFCGRHKPSSATITAPCARRTWTACQDNAAACFPSRSVASRQCTSSSGVSSSWQRTRLRASKLPPLSATATVAEKTTVAERTTTSGYSDADSVPSVQPSEDYLALVEAQLQVLRSFLNNDVRCTVYIRTSESYTSGRLQLRKIASSPANDTDDGDAVMLLGAESVLPSGASDREAEAFLVQEKEYCLPDGLTVVVSLVRAPFLVGLLVLERLREPSAGDDAFTQQELSIVSGVAQTLAIACTLDQRSLLLHQATAQHAIVMGGMLEQTHGPLAALRTLGKMLQGRLRQGELGRDMVANMLVQGEAVKDVVQALQATMHPLRNLAMPQVGQPQLTEAAATGVFTALPPPPTPLMLSMDASTTSTSNIAEELLPLVKASLAPKRNVVLLCNMPPAATLPLALIDVASMRRVLSNILDFLVENTQSTGTAEVAASLLSIAHDVLNSRGATMHVSIDMEQATIVVRAPAHKPVQPIAVAVAAIESALQPLAELPTPVAVVDSPLQLSGSEWTITLPDEPRLRRPKQRLKLS
eukprot:jgi/Chlat1/8327/Chrsp8S09243